ncbi:MAG: hypothetical protein ABS79_06030 [Planctomycetes bacterium SCN 63-9]|nr:MAG: hypothetical protein ABS79_06030 [Planctomycetes bacterium SCN 63-9]
MTPGRRTLRFASLDEIMPEVESLVGRNRTVGNWSFAQICNHLAAVARRTVDMPASTPVDPNLFLGEEKKKAAFESGLIPEGLPAPEGVEPASVGDEPTEVEGLRQALTHYKASPGPVMTHRFFGPLTKAEWDRLQCMHCAHHLSFVIPEDV